MNRTALSFSCSHVTDIVTRNTGSDSGKDLARLSQLSNTVKAEAILGKISQDSI